MASAESQVSIALSIQKKTKKTHHDVASVLLSISSDEEEEQSQVNAPEDVPLNSISDDEWSSDDEWLLTSL